MLFYHATPKDNLEGILSKGILPKSDFIVFNGRKPVIWMASRPDVALINAFDVDLSRNNYRSEGSQRYVILYVDVSSVPSQKACYKRDTFWVFQTIEPQNIVHVQEESADTAALIANFL